MPTEKFANEVVKYDNVTVEQWTELKALLLKSRGGESPPWVRIPHPPLWNGGN